MAVPTENLISDISALGDKLTAARTSIGSGSLASRWWLIWR